MSDLPEMPPALYRLAKHFFIGIILALILYGIAVTVYVQTMRALYASASKSSRNKWFSVWIPMIFSTLLFSFGTIFIITDTTLLVEGVLNHPLFPGGPFAYILAHYTDGYVVLCNTSFELSLWLADAYMIHRLFIIYTGMRYVVILPILVYLAAVVTGIFLLIQSSRANESLYSNVNFGLVNFSIAAALNMLIAALICARLLFHRQRLRVAVGSSGGYLKVYTSASAIVVESSALYAVCSLLFIAPFGAENSVSQVFLAMLSQIQVISPLLVVLRFAKESAWTTATTRDVQDIGITRTDSRQSSLEKERDLEGDAHPVLNKV